MLSQMKFKRRKENEKISQKNERKIAQACKKRYDYAMRYHGNDSSVYL